MISGSFPVRFISWEDSARLARLLAGFIKSDTSKPPDMVIAIGSGGPYAQAAAKALLDHTDLPAREIAVESMKIAARLCIYTNDHIKTFVLEGTNA